MITIRHVTRRFGCFTAVDDVSLHVERGASLALWGANGAGKTTLLRCVLGLLRFEGRIEIDGMDVRSRGKDVRRLIGYVPQEVALHDDLRLIEAVTFVARLRRCDGPETVEALRTVGLDAHAQKRIGECSGGMRQRCALALALLGDPPVLVMDELTSNLDSAAQGSFLELLHDQKKAGRTILFTSHRHHEVEALADRVALLRDGRLERLCAPQAMADELGLRASVRLYLPPDRIDDAIAALATHGYSAQRNGVSIAVETPLRQKGTPLRLLALASIPVHDFELQGDANSGGDPSHGRDPSGCAVH
ncbi:MAG: ABC transporter ATP-binding protein [Phycisphaeraceae bacterium]|nr:ABC transporter ATP-binding protein [Phycisphaeraceae bacterium]